MQSIDYTPLQRGMKVKALVQPGFEYNETYTSNQEEVKQRFFIRCRQIYAMLVTHLLVLGVETVTVLLFFKHLEILWVVLFLCIQFIHLLFLLTSKITQDLVRDFFQPLESITEENDVYQMHFIYRNLYVFFFFYLSCVAMFTVYMSTGSYRREYSRLRSNFLYDSQTFVYDCNNDQLNLPSNLVQGYPESGIILNLRENEGSQVWVSLHRTYRFCTMKLHLNATADYRIDILQGESVVWSQDIEKRDFVTFHPSVQGDRLMIQSDCNMYGTHIDAYQIYLSKSTNQLLGPRYSECRDTFVNIPMIFVIFVLVDVVLHVFLLVFLYDTNLVIKENHLF